MEALKYENRAWCRVEVVVGQAAVQPPHVIQALPFERYRLELFAQDDPGRSGPLVEDLNSVRIVRDFTPVGSQCSVLNPGDGVLSMESDR